MFDGSVRLKNIRAKNVRIFNKKTLSTKVFETIQQSMQNGTREDTVRYDTGISLNSASRESSK